MLAGVEHQAGALRVRASGFSCRCGRRLRAAAASPSPRTRLHLHDPHRRRADRRRRHPKLPSPSCPYSPPTESILAELRLLRRTPSRPSRRRGHFQAITSPLAPAPTSVASSPSTASMGDGTLLVFSGLSDAGELMRSAFTRRRRHHPAWRHPPRPCLLLARRPGAAHGQRDHPAHLLRPLGRSGTHLLHMTSRKTGSVLCY